MFKSQKVGPAPNHQKWSEMGPEWSPGHENRPPGMPRPFPSLWDQSRGPKKTPKRSTQIARLGSRAGVVELGLSKNEAISRSNMADNFEGILGLGIPTWVETADSPPKM